MTEARSIRLLAVAILAVFGIFAGALVSIPLLIREPLPVVRPDSAISFTLGEERAVGRLQVSRGGAFILVIGVDASTSGAAPAKLELSHQQGARLAPTLQTVADGRYRAAGRLDVPGQWRIQLIEDPELSFEFVLAEW